MHTNGYHNHTHNHCKHDIAYCQICDVCYCTKCGKEWGEKLTFTYTYDPYIWTYRGVPYTVTYNYSNGDYSLATSNGTAVKDEKITNAFYSSSDLNNHTIVHSHNTK